MRDGDAPLGQKLLDVSEAEREAQVHPDRALDDVARKAVAGVRERGHTDRLRCRAGHSKAVGRDKPEFYTAAFVLGVELLERPIRLENGASHLPAGPGLGVEIDREALDRLTVQSAS
jgi:hypothetical protein